MRELAYRYDLGDCWDHETASSLAGRDRDRSMKSASASKPSVVKATAAGDDHERIRPADIGPPCWQGEQHAVLVVEVDPVLTPVVAVSDELEVPAGQRVEPVRHPHTSVPIIRTGCR